MLDPLERDSLGVPMPARSLFLIDPEKRTRFAVTYPATTGRNFVDILRVVDAVFLTEACDISTPASWSPRDKVFSASRADAQDCRNLPSGRRYFRLVDCPLTCRL